MAATLVAGQNAKAATIERSADGNLTINVFASIIESFRVTIENADIVLAGVAPASDGLLDLNGGMAGFDGLKSVAASVCKDDLDAAPAYLDALKTKCAVINNGNSSNSSLKFDVDFAVKVELSGPGSVDLTVTMQGTAADSAFANTSILFDASSASLSGLVDQASHVLNFHGEAPFAGGPNYDDTIVVSVTKN